MTDLEGSGDKPAILQKTCSTTSENTPDWYLDRNLWDVLEQTWFTEDPHLNAHDREDPPSSHCTPREEVKAVLLGWKRAKH